MSQFKVDTRINHQISAKQVRLINEEGVNVGVVLTSEAQRKADAAGLDLVEISPMADPPVCKIMDFGKYRYELQKKAKEAHKHQKVVSLKEVKFRPVIGAHDFEIKMNNATRFLEEGDKVKFILTFKGREIDHQELGHQLMAKVKERFIEIGKLDNEPRMEGKNIIMVVSPK